MSALILMRLKSLNPQDKEYPKELDCSWYILKTVSLLKKKYIYIIIFIMKAILIMKYNFNNNNNYNYLVNYQF